MLFDIAACGEMMGFYVFPIVASLATRWTLKKLLIRIGLITEEEGHYFFHRRTPIEWTEGIDT